MSAAPLISFENAALGYGRRVVLPHVHFQLTEGDYFGIVGPNGSGKTTLLRTTLGLLKPLSGRVIHHRPLRFGYVPQARTTDDLFPITVREIVLMGRSRQLGLLRRPTRQDHEQVEAALAEVALSEHADRLLRELSGGQRQRALMARALASEPDVLVLDEPTSAMDIAAEAVTMELIGRLNAQKGLLIVLVSHHLNAVANHVRTVALLGGNHLEIGPTADVIAPQRLEALFGRAFSVVEQDGRRLVW